MHDIYVNSVTAAVSQSARYPIDLFLGLFVLPSELSRSLSSDFRGAEEVQYSST